MPQTFNSQIEINLCPGGVIVVSQGAKELFRTQGKVSDLTCDLTGQIATVAEGKVNFLVRVVQGVKNEVFTLQSLHGFGLRRDKPGTHCEAMRFEGRSDAGAMSLIIEDTVLSCADENGKSAYAFLWNNGSASSVSLLESSSTGKWAFAPGNGDVIRSIGCRGVSGNVSQEPRAGTNGRIYGVIDLPPLRAGPAAPTPAPDWSKVTAVHLEVNGVRLLRYPSAAAPQQNSAVLDGHALTFGSGKPL